MKRKIDDILDFRTDISPFLVHLTRNVEGGKDAKNALNSILTDPKQLKPGATLVSLASYGINIGELSSDDQLKYFGAVCFTETPLSEIHCLLEVSERKVELEPYGIVFKKENLKSKGVSPALYLNNEQGGKDKIFQALCSLINSHSQEATEILPLFSFFGKYIVPPTGTMPPTGNLEFLWEREWRYPSALGAFNIDPSDVCLGLCEHEEIEEFEGMYPGISFIDPRRNLKWYATKLVQVRKSHNLTCSIV